MGRSCTTGTVRCGDSVYVSDVGPNCGWFAIKYVVNGSSIASQCGGSYYVPINRDNTSVYLEVNSGHSCRTSYYPGNGSCPN